MRDGDLLQFQDVAGGFSPASPCLRFHRRESLPD
jgi:hypothetical protein